MEVKCTYSKMVPIEQLIPNPRNTNNHSTEQVDLLAKIMKYQGIRHPIVVSNLSGFVGAGHCRRLAALKNGWTEFPVDFQDFENEAQEYAFLESDNHIAELADHDKDKMIAQIKELEIKVDLELFGMPNLALFENNNSDDFTDSPIIDDEKDQKLCPHCGGVL